MWVLSFSDGSCIRVPSWFLHEALCWDSCWKAFLGHFKFSSAHYPCDTLFLNDVFDLRKRLHPQVVGDLIELLFLVEIAIKPFYSPISSSWLTSQSKILGFGRVRRNYVRCCDSTSCRMLFRQAKLSPESGYQYHLFKVCFKRIIFQASKIS